MEDKGGIAIISAIKCIRTIRQGRFGDPWEEFNRLREVYINSLEKSRKLKLSIPITGMDNIPLQHEFKFEIILS